MRTKSVLLIAIILISIVSLTACSSTEQFFVFGTFLDMTVEGVSGGKVTREVFTYMESLETLLSPTVEGSDLHKINNAKVGESVKCSAETMELLSIVEVIFDLSDGAYDPSIYPLVRLWNFSGDKFSQIEGKTPPTDEDIAKALSVVGFDKAFTVNHLESTVTKNAGYDGAMLDFGGVAKGYAVDKAMDGFDGKALVNLGGNIGAKGKEYTIGIGNPRESATPYFGSFTLRAGELISTSGDYERFFTYEGKRYHHILNPATGKPSDSVLISVSVVSTNGAVGDALSTAIMVLGAEKGKALITRINDEFDLNVKAVLISSDLTYEVVGDLGFVKK